MHEYVRVVIPGDDPREKTTSRAFAEAHELEILDQPGTGSDGTLLPETRLGGRPVKPFVTLPPLGARQDGEAAAPGDAGEGEPEDPYDGWLRAQLIEEVERRNAERSDPDRHIVPGGKPTVATLKAALVADDTSTIPAVLADPTADNDAGATSTEEDHR